MSRIAHPQFKLLWVPSLSLLLGMALYAFYRPEIAGFTLPITLPSKTISAPWLHQHLPDALWAFAFSYCLLLFLPFHTKKRIKILLAFLLPILAECFQLFDITAGTFDVLDILSMCFGTLCSIAVINFYKK